MNSVPMVPRRVTAGRSSRSRTASALLRGLLCAVLMTGCERCRQNRPVACNAVTCKESEARVCDRCVTPRKVGEACSTNPCDDNGLCELNVSCVPASSGSTSGTCQALGQGLFSQCALTPDKLCPAPYTCVDPACWPPDIQTTVPICFPSRKVGAACDSDYKDAKCLPCEAHLRCLNGYCRKACETRTDCPCDKYFPGDEFHERGSLTSFDCVAAFGLPGKYCYQCAAVGQGCGYNHPCCDAGAICPDPNGGKSNCCLGRGASCAQSSECCSGDRCFGTPLQCRECKKAGDSCTASQECCDGSCKNNVCYSPCMDGGDCTISGKKGECSKGKWQCKPTTKECVATAPTSSPEVCDGKDNDCNGIVDDLGDCEEVPTLFLCQPNFKAKGKRVCFGTSPVCQTTPGVDFCTACGQMSGQCGACDGSICANPGNVCPPNMLCRSEATYRCANDPECAGGRPPCWHPSQIGKCCKDNCTP